MRRSLLLAGFVLSAAVLLGALAWISHLTVDLEAREQDARQRAAFEERVRLSLWRMDSAVASLLAQENARPVELFDPAGSVASAAPASARETAAQASTGRTAASGPPPLAEASRPYLAARFEIGPSGDVREWATARRGQGQAAAALARDVLLAGLRQGPLAARPEPTPETGEPPHRTGTMAAARPAQPVQRPGTTAPAPLKTEQAPGAGATSEAAQLQAAQPSGAQATVKTPPPKQATPAAKDEPPSAQSRQARLEPRPAPASDPVAREMAKQQKLNQTEFEQRLTQNQAYEPQAAEPTTRAGGASAAEVAPGAAAAPGTVSRPPAPPLAASSAATSPAPRPPAARSPAAAAATAPTAAAPSAAAQTGASSSAAPFAPSAPSASSASSAPTAPSASFPPSASPAPLAPSASFTGAPPAAASSAPPAPAASRPSARPPRPPRPSPQASPRRRPPGGVPSAPPGRALGTVAAVWVGDDLVLARRVARGGEELLQGARLDGRGTREWLTAQVGDLLPRAALFPLRPGETADPGRRLALLPLRLDAGPLPPAPAATGSPVRLGLAVAFAAVLLSLAAAGLQLAATQRLARRRADFVSAVTHELRTPLTTFRLYTEMLAGDMIPDGERSAYLGTLREEADRLGHLVENVLAFARLERGRGRSKVETVELAPLVGEAVALLAPRVEREGARLAAEVPPGAAAARVRVDRVAVARILQNLADNACKYGRNPADPRLHLTVQLRERRAVITLRDHGPGLARGGRRRLFHPFHRSAEQATGEAPGVGLGLALSQRLARDFGGDLRAVDPADGGAAFELTLPLAP
jgi:signal transduction histidine kinase